MQKLPSAFALPKKYVFSHLWTYSPVFNPRNTEFLQATEEEMTKVCIFKGIANEGKMTEVYAHSIMRYFGHDFQEGC